MKVSISDFTVAGRFAELYIADADGGVIAIDEEEKSPSLAGVSGGKLCVRLY